MEMNAKIFWVKQALINMYPKFESIYEISSKLEDFSVALELSDIYEICQILIDRHEVISSEDAWEVIKYRYYCQDEEGYLPNLIMNLFCAENAFWGNCGRKNISITEDEIVDMIRERMDDYKPRDILRAIDRLEAAGYIEMITVNDESYWRVKV